MQVYGYVFLLGSLFLFLAANRIDPNSLTQRPNMHGNNLAPKKSNLRFKGSLSNNGSVKPIGTYQWTPGGAQK